MQLDMEFDYSEVQVLLGLDDDVDVSFNITLILIFQEIGTGRFCLGDMVRSMEFVAWEKTGG